MYSRGSVSALISSTSNDLPRISVMSSRGLDQAMPSSNSSWAVMNPFTLIFLTEVFTILPSCSILVREAVTLHRPLRFGRGSFSRRPDEMGLMRADGLVNREVRLFAMFKVRRLDDDSLQNIFLSLLSCLHSSSSPLHLFIQV